MKVLAPEQQAGFVNGMYTSSFGYAAASADKLTGEVVKAPASNRYGCEAFSGQDAAQLKGKWVYIDWEDPATGKFPCGSAVRFNHVEAAGGQGVVLGSVQERHEVGVDGEPVSMPLREFELLELFLRHPGRVLTRRQIIERLWGPDYEGDTKTLDVHVKRLRGRIEMDASKPVLITTVRGLGYRLDSGSER